MKKLLFEYNPWWEENYDFSHIIEREEYTPFIYSHLKKKSILFLTGLRRVGKTTLIKLAIKELLKTVTPQHILYISLDDYLLRNKSILEIIDEYRTLHKIKTSETIYLFFDEITYKNDYHLQLKNLYDKTKAKIVASSSSSSLLLDKKAYLTGRSITLEVSPLNFNEYLTFNKINIKNRDEHLLKAYFEDYIQSGGLPENTLNPNREYLMSLIDDIIQKDITAFYAIKNHDILRDYFLLLMERSGKQLSINKIANILKMSPDTARRYLNYFESTYLIHLVPRWGKTNEKLLSAKKIYACDLGIKHLFIGKRDFGSYFENYILLQLRRKAKPYYIYKDGIEIDFYTDKKEIIESKYYSNLSKEQEQLFYEFPANKRLLINSVAKLSLLDTI